MLSIFGVKNLYDKRNLNCDIMPLLSQGPYSRDQICKKGKIETKILWEKMIYLNVIKTFLSLCANIHNVNDYG